VLETEEAAKLDQDVAKIIEVFQDENESVRLQASGLLFGLARNRQDGTEALRRAIPVWISQFDDQNSRVRDNARRSIAILRPEVPAEAVPALLRVVGLGEAPPEAVVALALVRCSRYSPDAQQRMADLMSAAKPIETRRTVIVAIGQAGTPDPILVGKLREALEDRRLVLDALRSAAALGRGAVGLRAAIIKLAAGDPTEEISKAATTALKRIEQ
jgi:HEAT repeat protein